MNKSDRKAEFESYVRSMIDSAITNIELSQAERVRAIRYYNGEVPDLPSEPNRSSVVSNELRHCVKDLLPSIMRILFGNDRIVEYVPTSPKQEQACYQATEYVNRIVVPSCNAEDAIYDAIQDAIICKTGILKWCAYEELTQTSIKLPPLPESVKDAAAGELQNAKFEEYGEPIYDENIGETLHSFVATGLRSEVKIELRCIPRDSFLIAPGAISIEDSPIVGNTILYSRSDLIAMGYDKNIVNELPSYSYNQQEDFERQAREGIDYSDEKTELSKSNELILIYEVYVREDMDGDGVTEIYKICVADESFKGGETRFLSEPELVDEYPYAEVKIEREAHVFEGRSLSEDILQLQKITTKLLREALDNIYAQNLPITLINPSELTSAGLDAVLNPEFGKPIQVRSQNGMEAIKHFQIPFMADQTLMMIENIRKSVTDRTGISDQSGNLDPNQLTNVTATAISAVSDSATATAEMIIRTLARGGIRKAFKGLLKLVVENATGERFVKVGREWVNFDPSTWDTDIDCEINIGLGGGSRTRDLNSLLQIKQVQEQIMGNMGVDNPYVKPSQYYNTLRKMAEISGFTSSDPYFTAPNDQEVLQIEKNRTQEAMSPDKLLQMEKDAEMKLEQLRAQTKKELEAFKVDSEAKLKIELEQMKLKTQVMIEEAQRQADISVREKELENKIVIEEIKAYNKPSPIVDRSTGENDE